MKKILIHHHAIAFKDENGIWIQSVIGQWITSLSKYFGEIGILSHVSNEKIPIQDTLILENNVVLHSLGPAGKFQDRFTRSRRIIEVCSSLKNKYDLLLIRGITPRQLIIWKNIKVKLSKKYFLLVCSIDNDIKFWQIKSFLTFYQFYMMIYRRNELKKMLASGSLFVNGLNLIKETKRLLNKESYFIPTNTLSINEFTEFKVRGINKQIKLLFCGRIEEKKGILEAIMSLKILEKKNLNISMDFIGQFQNTNFEDSIKSMIENLKIKTPIKFHGRIPYGDKLFKFYKEADIFIFPTYTEGFPHVIWEAAANCCPVLTTPVGSIPTILKHGEHCLFFAPKNPQEIADAIIDILNDEKLRKKIIKNLFMLAKSYTLEICASKLSKKIESDLNN